MFFLAAWARGMFVFLFGQGACLLFAVWARACLVFYCLGGGCAFFAVWAGGVFFVAVWAGDGSSLTYRYAWLIFKGPNNRKDQTAKNEHGSGLC